MSYPNHLPTQLSKPVNSLFLKLVQVGFLSLTIESSDPYSITPNDQANLSWLIKMALCSSSSQTVAISESPKGLMYLDNLPKFSGDVDAMVWGIKL